MSRAFLSRAVLAAPTTRALAERLGNGLTPRRLCGWENVGAVPSEATLSRALAGFATSEWAGRVHGASLGLR